MMGSGKTSAAINLMNAEPDRKFVFITPLLDEVKRIKQSCPGKRFVEPLVTKKSNKSENLIELLENQRNIASTHSLFKRCTPYTASLIERGKYTLILDEVCDVVETLKLPPSDLNLYLKHDVISVSETGRVYWNEEDYGKDGDHAEVMRSIVNGHVVMENNELLIWKFPYSIFDAFEEVIVLTYMFDAQFQKYYYDMNDARYEHIGVRERDGIYEFCDTPTPTIFDFGNLIHIIDDDKMNECGEEDNALSSSWCERQAKVRKHPALTQIKLNAENMVRHKWNVRADQVLWSTHVDMRTKFQGRGYSRAFLAFNYRATNNYRERTHLMYLINVYPLVDLCNFFASNGITIDRDKYATSTMIQWIWRSAIRDGNEIWLYLPSRRMRGLLQDWIEEVSVSPSPATTSML
jgi:hypothetical protein